MKKFLPLLFLLMSTAAYAAATNVNTVGLTTGNYCPINPDTVLPLTTKGDVEIFTTTNARLGVGTDGFDLTANSNDANGVTYQQGYGAPAYVSANWYGPPLGTYSTTASSAGGTTAYVTPFYVNKRTTFTDIGIWTTAVTGTKMHLAIYSGNPVKGATITLVPGSDGEDASLSAGAMDTVTFGTPVTLDKGWYGLEVFPNGTVTMNTTSSSGLGAIEGVTDGNTLPAKLGATGQTYGQLGSITLAVVNDGSNPYAIMLKAQ